MAVDELLVEGALDTFRNYDKLLKSLFGLDCLKPDIRGRIEQEEKVRQEEQKKRWKMVRRPVYPPVEVVCSTCGAIFLMSPSVYRDKKKRSKNGKLFCSRRCFHQCRKGYRRGWKHDYGQVYELYDKLKDKNEVSYELRIPYMTICSILKRRLYVDGNES